MRSGVVVWITGLPSSGKSRFAVEAVRVLRERSVLPACVLDGDDVRGALVPPFGYSADERANFYETLARLAALVASQGLVVFVPATAHRRKLRERARQLAPRYLEVWIDTPAEECERRDSKGLYAKSRSGSLDELPGAGEEYEAPTAPEFVAHGGKDSVAIDALVVELLAISRTHGG